MFSDIRVLIVNKDSLKAVVSCKLADAFYLSGMRIVETKRGRILAMPAKRDSRDEYADIYFPVNRQVRMELEKMVFEKYDEAIQAKEVNP